MRLKPLKTGTTIGILGGGQLGRMLALAAARLGLQCHVYTPEPDDCALQVVQKRTVADYADNRALRTFAADCDVITYEFENVPAVTAALLAARKPVLPDPTVLKATQDRLIEKNFVRKLGLSTVDFASVSSLEQLTEAAKAIGLPAVLKTRRFGYDGKGQAAIRVGDDLVRKWRSMKGAPCVLERFANFEQEVSVIVARGADGILAYFDVTENVHRNHILKFSSVPAQIPVALAAKARLIAGRIAHALDYVGVMAVEMFVVRGARGPSLLVNEIAPRVHNSGHWTIDGATVSQFEQHIRAIAGWPLVRPARHGQMRMINLIGDEILNCGSWLRKPGSALHIYGKGQPSAGRKMGHVTVAAKQ